MTEQKSSRFGYSLEYLQKVYRENSMDGVIRAGCYVPSEEEVRTMDAEELTQILIDWLWESPSELIPSNEQIKQVRMILSSRSDHAKVKKAIDECDSFLSDEYI